ncbi:SchA/CurD [Actinomadura sp. CNU-125]|uniref:SchA/CurD-like domain-containing protein n=1 Tax=Actinomadura sp. CNU-125 TaxID=1904961 RepID=UPI000965512D|nr:SchA/CurD-like domain-containing protein [Actinomadura sp. CNU-125]OLT26331.1 SchA/CurD [Actinomadura sp. CNU-125]
MPFAAITYDIKPGCEEEIAEIFGDFKRVRNPAVRDGSGREVGRVLGTALFIRDDTMVRFIQYEGGIEDVARFMAAQPGVREVERRLKPYLASPRDTDTVEGFVATFTESSMRCISQLFPESTGAAR